MSATSSVGRAITSRRRIRCKVFLPVRVLSKLFRRLFLERLQGAFERGELVFHGGLEPLAQRGAFEELLDETRKLPWVVYAKRPFGGPEQVLECLGRYTHRVAISNNRLVRVDDGEVTFRYKDYRRENQQREMTLGADEFIRRFLLHVLPRGFQRIRQYGLLSNRRRGDALARCRDLLGAPAIVATKGLPREAKATYERVTGLELDRCPACREGRMRELEVVAPAARSQSLFVLERPPMNSS